MILFHHVDDGDVGEAVLVVWVFLQGLHIFIKCSIEILLVEESIALELDLLGLFASLDHYKVSLQVVHLQLANDCTVGLVGKDSFKVRDSFVEARHPAVCSASLDQSPHHEFVIKILIRGILLMLDSLDLLYDVAAIVSCWHKASELDEASCTIKPSHQELWVLLEGLGVSVDSRLVVEALEEVVGLVFEPDRVFVLDINENIFVLLICNMILRLGIGRLLQLTFSRGQMREFLLCEAHLHLLLRTHLRYLGLRLGGIGRIVFSINLFLGHFVYFGLILIVFLGRFGWRHISSRSFLLRSSSDSFWLYAILISENRLVLLDLVASRFLSHAVFCMVQSHSLRIL